MRRLAARIASSVAAVAVAGGPLSCGPAAYEPQPFPISAAALGTIGVPLEQAMRPGIAECSVHHAPLDEATVAIIYGMPYMGSSEYYAARESQFPNACSKVTCCGGSGGPVSATVRRCERCTAAELEWDAQQ